jgi:DNA-binding response OmpR family regulator
LLICEDDYLIATDLANELTGLGAIVVATATHTGRVFELAAAPELAFDAAVLDVNLAGEMIFAAAQALAARGVALVFYSGYARQDLPAELVRWPFVQKPAEPSAVIIAIRAALTPEPA